MMNNGPFNPEPKYVDSGFCGSFREVECRSLGGSTLFALKESRHDNMYIPMQVLGLKISTNP